LVSHYILISIEAHRGEGGGKGDVTAPPRQIIEKLVYINAIKTKIGVTPLAIIPESPLGNLGNI
jgi:hypothetical protein